MQYTVDYFINKFDAIPEDMWTIREFGEDGQPHCALGHCGERDKDEPAPLEALCLMRLSQLDIVSINDGDDGSYQQPTAKQRILASLYDVKKMQEAVDQAKNISSQQATLTH